MARAGIVFAAGAAAAAVAVAQVPSHGGKAPSLKQVAGQRIVFGFDGTAAPSALIDRIHRGEAAGVILFSRNISSRHQLRSLTHSLQHARPQGDPPLIIAIDQEGGLVKRLSGAPDESAADMGRNGSSKHVRAEGRETAQNLLDVGVNVNFAPVVDVARPGSVMERTERSFSRDPDKVARLGGAFKQGLEKGPVAATAKHFPGLGAATKDEDFHVNRIEVSKSTLRNKDEVPYVRLAHGHVPLVMVSTAVYPPFDSRPALFSPTLANTELRSRIGFTGASITDDLDVPAIAKYGSPEHRAVLSAHAGMDLLLFAQSYSDGRRAAAELVRARKDGRLSKTGMQRAADRISALRKALAG